MQLFIKKQIGKTTYTFTVEGKNLHELIEEKKKLSFYDVHKCGICGSNNLDLNSRIAQKKFKYTFIQCNDCRATLNFGQQMENPDVFYLRKNENKEFDWKEYKIEEAEA